MKKQILGMALVASFAAGSVQAGVISDSYSNAMATTEIAQTGLLAMFDASLGTLDSAVLTFTGNSISTTVLENTAVNDQSFSFFSDLNFFLDLTSVSLTAPAPAFTTILATTGGFVTLGAGAVLDLGTTTDSGSYTVNVTGADLAAFIGTGTFSTGCSTISGSTFTGGGGNINNIQSTSANCAGEVIYNYSDAPVQAPEPTSIALLGLGLIGVGAIRRRKQAK